MTPRQQERVLGWAAVCCLGLALGIVMFLAGLAVYGEQIAEARLAAQGHQVVAPVDRAAALGAAGWAVASVMTAWDAASAGLFAAALVCLLLWRRMRELRMIRANWQQLPEWRAAELRRSGA